MAREGEPLSIEALTFDVFGTVVDWRSGVVRELEALARGRSELASLDLEAFADAWRGLYRPTIEAVTRGEREWATFEVLQRQMLDQVLERFEVATLAEVEKQHLSGVWNRLDGWPDSAAGLARLRSRAIVSTLSNGSLRQLVNLAKFAGLQWDVILSVELFRAYKPDPRVYRGAVELLQAPAAHVMMVAAHVYDLRAAQAEGMRTAFVRRPLEWGPGGSVEQPESGEFDLLVDSIEELAERLGY